MPGVGGDLKVKNCFRVIGYPLKDNGDLSGGSLLPKAGHSCFSLLDISLIQPDAWQFLAYKMIFA
jgi:hypothetical protein